MQRKRDPKGIPTGGRFAEERKDEVDIDLANETAADIVAGFVQTGRVTLGPDGEVVDCAPEPSEEDLELARDQLGLSASEDDVHSLAASWSDGDEEEGDVASLVEELAAKYGRTSQEVGDWVDSLSPGDDGYDAQDLDELRLAYAAAVADEADEDFTTIASMLERDGEITLDASEHDDNVFEMVQVHSVGETEEGMVTVTGNVSLNIEDGLAPYMPDFSGEDDPDAAQDAWLDDRAPIISAWVRDRYGAEDENVEGWDHQTYEFAVDVPDSTPVEQLTTVLREKTKALTFYNESDHGSSGHENMFDALNDHLVEKDREAEAVAAGYIERLINTSEAISGKENGLDERARAQAVDDARMFMHRNRNTVARMLADVDGAHPLGYAITEAHIGDWLAGARSGEATPLDMLGRRGGALRASAALMGRKSAIVNADGNIDLV